MRVMVAVPCLDYIDADFVQSLVKMNHVGEVDFQFLTGSLVYVSRERLSQLAIAMKADYVLWLDSDMVFGPELLADLLDANVDICSGLCFRRRPPFTPVLYKTLRYGTKPEDYVHEEYLDYPIDSLFEVDGAGFGAVLVKTEVLKTVFDRYGNTFEPMRGFGEDLSFCIRARQCGYKIWCNSKAKLGHVTRTLANEDAYLAMRAKK